MSLEQARGKAVDEQCHGDRMMAVDLKATAMGIELSQLGMLFEQKYSYGAGITISITT